MKRLTEENKRYYEKIVILTTNEDGAIECLSNPSESPEEAKQRMFSGKNVQVLPIMSYSRDFRALVACSDQEIEFVATEMASEIMDAFHEIMAQLDRYGVVAMSQQTQLVHVAPYLFAKADVVPWMGEYKPDMNQHQLKSIGTIAPLDFREMMVESLKACLMEIPGRQFYQSLQQRNKGTRATTGLTDSTEPEPGPEQAGTTTIKLSGRLQDKPKAPKEQPLSVRHYTTDAYPIDLKEWKV